MGSLAYTILLVVLFFGFVLYSIRKDERRRSDRRQQRLHSPVEQRNLDRRDRSLRSYLAWVLRSLRSRFIR